MSVMTTQPPLPITPEASATLVGEAAALIEDQAGGRVFLHGNLVYAWAPGEDALRRWSAAQMARLKAAPIGQIGAAFGVDPTTVWRWGQTLSEEGVAGLASAKRGPKGPHRLTGPVIAWIQALAAGGATLAAIAAQVGLSTTTVRRALTMPIPDAAAEHADDAEHAEHADDAEHAEHGHADDGHADDAGAAPGGRADGDEPVPDAPTDQAAGREQPAVAGPVLPVLPAAVDRGGERALARFGLIEQALPVFAPAGRVPLAGLLLAMPALEASGLLGCARSVFTALPNGFYGLETTLVEAVLRTLTGEARAEGATRIDPVAFGRILGLDRAPEVKTIRRKIGLLAGTGKAERLIAAMAATHLARPEAAAASSSDPDDPDRTGVPVGLVLYVDGHVRAYQGTRKVAKTHLARLRFPAPATLETWVCDAAGDPVLVVLAEPGASLASELRRLMPELRAAVGDDRRVLVGFDRGGWSPALFAHLHQRGFDVLTWRKGPAPDIDPAAFTELTFIDQAGRQHAWRAADTTTELPIGTTPRGGSDAASHGTHAEDEAKVFAMRQVTLAVPATKHQRSHAGGAGTGKGVRQIHILTTRTDLPAEEIIYRMGSRWRQENYFRYARMHFELDSHDSYTATDEDPGRLVPNPAKKRAYRQVLAARSAHEQALARTDAAMLEAKFAAPGQPVLITNQAHDALTADLRQAQAALTQAQSAHQNLPTRLPLEQVNPAQQVLDTQVKLLTHAIRMAAFNTATSLARGLRIHTGYARANHEAHALIRQVLTSSGDIDPTIEGVLTIRLDPLPTARASTAIAELCQHLTATATRYPGTDLILRYEIKTVS